MNIRTTICFFEMPLFNPSGFRAIATDAMGNFNRLRYIMRFSWVSFLLLPFLFLPGCSSKGLKGLVPAEGILLYDDQPLAGAIVTFSPKETTPTDRAVSVSTDAEGRFVLKTLGQQGVLPNEYLISVVKNALSNEPTAREQLRQAKEAAHQAKEAGKRSPPKPRVKKIESLIPSRYNKTATSGLSWTIGPEGARDIRIELRE